MENLKLKISNLKFIGLVVAISVVISSLIFSVAFVKSKRLNRTVTVKGLSEKVVKTNLGVWPITFIEKSNSLVELQNQIQKSKSIVLGFFEKYGFEKNEISYSVPKIHDSNYEGRYSNIKEKTKYFVEVTISLRTTKMDKLEKAMQHSDELIKNGIVIATTNWENQTIYSYTDLNEIKPQMIEEATKNARKAAKKFAEDSNSKVGKIKKATQGYFSIQNRDRNSPNYKKIRVVTTIEYFLN